MLASSGALIGGGAAAGFGQIPDEPTEGGQVRQYDVHAINVDIVYNAFGQHQPNGVMYVLEESLDAARRASGCIPGESDIDTSIIEPLVIRANQGADPGEEIQYRWFANEEGTIFFHDHFTGSLEGQNGTFASIVVEPEDST